MEQEASPKPAEETVAREFMAVLPRLPKYAKLMWTLVRDPDLTRKQRAALMAAVGYSVSPIDAIPGIIPVIGQLDDLAIVLYTARWVLHSMPAARSDAYLAQCGLSSQILDDDLSLVKRSGVRILRKAFAVMGVTALWVFGVGKVAGRRIIHELRKHDPNSHRTG